MVAWPASLPPMRLGDTRGLGDGRIRFQPSVGPAMVRQGAKQPHPVTRQLRLTGTQLQTLYDFIEQDLEGGTLQFDHEDPLDDATRSVRLVRWEEPQSIVGGAPGDRQWMITLQLEVMP